MLNHYVGVAVVWPAGMGHSCRWSPTPGVARELGARKMKLDLILFICILCIVFVIFVFVFDGPFMQLAPNTKSGQKAGSPEKEI